jgi:RND family efflux transporter MFP subunit
MINKRKILQKIEGKITLLTLVFLLLIAYFFLAKKSNKYETVTPFFDKIIQGVYATGHVITANYIDITPNIAGRVENILVKEGDEVKKGQLLIKLEDSVEIKALEELKASKEYLEVEEKRYKDLLKKGYVSESDYAAIVKEYSIVEAQIKGKENLLERMKIISPINGTVLKINTDVGKMLEKSSGFNHENAAISIGDLNKMIVRVNVDEEDISLISIGQKALITLNAFADKLLDGSVGKIGLKANTIDRTFEVDIDIKNNINLMVGMTADVNIITQIKDNAMLLPISCVIKGREVYVKKGGKIVKREIKTGLKDDNNIEILEGLQKKEEILLRPNLYLKDIK